jgi:hypothetical protein
LGKGQDTHEGYPYQRPVGTPLVGVRWAKGRIPTRGIPTNDL